MSKGMKVFLTVLLILALAAILVFVFSRCAKPQEPAAEPSPSPSVTPAESQSPSPSPTPSPSPSPSATPSPTPDDQQPGRETDGSLEFSINGQTVTENASLIRADFGTGIRGYGYNLYCLEGYSYSLEDGTDRYTADQTEDAWLALSFVPDTTVEAALPSFLDSYLAYREIEYVGDYALAGSLHTQGAVASDGRLTYTAYLADADGGILTFVFCYPNEAAEEQAPRLQAMLESFQFNY